MVKITFKSSPINTVGQLPVVGSPAPDFTLTKTDLTEATLADFHGKRIVLNVFPSVDTPVCATSVRRFNADASKVPNCVVLCVSMDLPFALSRFCGAEGLDDVIPVSDFRTGGFGRDYGVKIVDSPLAGLLSRAVIVIDETGHISYTQQVPEIAEEPDYEAALKALA